MVPIFKAQSFVETAGPCTLPSQNYAGWRNYKLFFQAQHHASCSFPDETAEHFQVLVIYSQDTARM